MSCIQVHLKLYNPFFIDFGIYGSFKDIYEAFDKSSIYFNNVLKFKIIKLIFINFVNLFGNELLTQVKVIFKKIEYR